MDGAILAGEVAAEIAVSAGLDNSMCCSHGGGNEEGLPRVSRFSAVGITDH